MPKKSAAVPPAGPAGPTSDRTPCHCLALRQAARHISLIYDRHLAAEGLRATQYSILSKLGRMGPQPIGKLADSMVIERTALSRTLRPLERDGLLRVGAGRNGRTREVALTMAGEARLKAATPLWQRAQAEFESEFGAAEAAGLRSALDRVVGR